MALKDDLRDFANSIKNSPKELAKTAKEGYESAKDIGGRVVRAGDLGNIADAVKAGASKAKEAYDRKKEVPSYKKGGIVKKTGLAKLHKGERVIPAKQVKKGKKKK